MSGPRRRGLGGYIAASVMLLGGVVLFIMVKVSGAA